MKKTKVLKTLFFQLLKLIYDAGIPGFLAQNSETGMILGKPVTDPGSGNSERQAGLLGTTPDWLALSVHQPEI